MNHFLFFIDRLSQWVGKAFGWCILVLCLATTYEVFVRYVLRAPTSWAFDISYIMYGTLFMMAGAYALSRNAHVRGDFVYRLWPPRLQASVELVLYFIFFFPGMLALIYAGIDSAAESVSFMPYGPIKTGAWPTRLEDVEELETELLRKHEEEKAAKASQQDSDGKEDAI